MSANGCEMAKATGSILDDLDDSVEAFCDRVGHSGFDEGEDAGLVAAVAVATNLRRGSRRLRKAEVVHRLKNRSAAHGALKVHSCSNSSLSRHAR